MLVAVFHCKLDPVFNAIKFLNFESCSKLFGHIMKLSSRLHIYRLSTVFILLSVMNLSTLKHLNMFLIHRKPNRGKE